MKTWHLVLALLLPGGADDVDLVLRHPEVQAWAERLRRTSGTRAVAMEDGNGVVGFFEDRPDHVVRLATFRVRRPGPRIETWDVELDAWRPFP